MFGISWFTAGKVSDYNPFVQVKAHKTSLSCRDFARLDCRKMLAGKPRFCFFMPFPLISGLAISTFATLVPEVGIDIAPPFPDAPAAAFGKTCPFTRQKFPFRSVKVPLSACKTCPVGIPSRTGIVQSLAMVIINLMISGGYVHPCHFLSFLFGGIVDPLMRSSDGH